MKGPVCTEGWFLAEWEDVYSSSAFILGRLCHLYALDKVADDMNLQNS